MRHILTSQRALVCILLVLFTASSLNAEPVSPQQVSFGGTKPVTACQTSTPNTAPRTLQYKPLIHIAADKLDWLADAPTWLSGNVKIAHQGFELSADEIRTDQSRNHLTINGHIVMLSNLLRVEADSANGDIANETMSLHNTRYRLASGATGTAKNITINGEDQAELNKVSYTTCSPNVTGWELRANNISLDNTKKQGSASGVVLEVGDIPVFYFPYLLFPTSDERQSGFLVPSVGQSSRRGFEVQVPYYWNIAPNLDATFAPKVMSKRGIQLNSQFRYLGENYSGNLDSSYLPHDRSFGDYRAFARWQHLHRLGQHWRLSADIAQFSDRQYFDDLGDEVGVKRDNYIESNITAAYTTDNSFFSVRTQRYELLNTSTRPFERQPELRAGTQQRITGTRFDYIDIGVRGQYTQFKHDSLEHGNRWEINPYLTYFFRNGYSQHHLEVGLRHAGYHLEDPVANTDRNLSRDMGYVEAWSQLTFERTFDWFGTKFHQTLEPRVGYVYQHAQEQNNFPVFDTSRPDTTYQQLFKKDRVVGIDRAADANHFTVGLWSRLGGGLLGTDFLELGIGQQWLLDDETEQLPTDAILERGASDTFADFRFRADEGVNFGVNLSWNHRSNIVTRTRLHLNYEEQRTHFHLAWHHRDQGTEFSDLALAIPLDENWRLLTRWQHAWSDDKSLDFIAGAEFENCCLAIRVLGRNYVNDNLNDYDQQILMQFELKGLSTVGHSVANPLDHGILSDK